MCNSFNKKFLDEAAKAIREENIDDTHGHGKYMEMAIEEAVKSVLEDKGGPFGCIIVKDGQIIATGNNKVTSTNDPTAHAEIIAIRKACMALNSFQLEDCTLYTSCEPCPMCMGAIYWARPKKVYYGCSKTDASNIGFDDKFIYRELDIEGSKRAIPFEQISRQEALKAFEAWENKEDKISY